VQLSELIIASFGKQKINVGIHLSAGETAKVFTAA
jgi:hypothetical protein